MAVTDTTDWINRTWERKDIPQDLKEIMVKTIIKNRITLEQILGNMELIYLREKQGDIVIGPTEAPQ